MARKIILKEDGLNNTTNTPSGYKFLGYDGESLSDKRGATISLIGGGSSNLSNTLLTGNLSGTSSIYMQSTDVININTTATASAGIIFSESNDYVYLASDGYWTDGNNSGVFAHNDGYFSLFGADWTTYLEGDANFLGFVVKNSPWNLYAGSDGKGGDYFKIGNGSTGIIVIGDPIFGGSDLFSDPSPQGVVFIGAASCRVTVNGTLNGEQELTKGSSFISSKESYFGFNGQFGTTAQYCSIINSSDGRIRGRNTITTDDYILYSNIISSNYGYIESSTYTSIIACGGTAIGFGVSAVDQDYVAVIAHNTLSLTSGSVLDYSTIVDNLYIDKKTFFRSTGTASGFANIPIVSSDPTTPVNGDIWAKDTGGTTTLNLRVGGVTKSVTLT